MMERRLVGKRTSSKLPELIALVLSRPLVSAGMIAKELTSRRGGAADCGGAGVAGDDGEGRFRAWDCCKSWRTITHGQDILVFVTTIASLESLEEFLSHKSKFATDLQFQLRGKPYFQPRHLDR